MAAFNADVRFSRDDTLGFARKLSRIFRKITRPKFPNEKRVALLLFTKSLIVSALYAIAWSAHLHVRREYLPVH
jgi:hypothetical protein